MQIQTVSNYKVKVIIIFSIKGKSVRVFLYVSLFTHESLTPHGYLVLKKHKLRCILKSQHENLKHNLIKLF